MWCKIKENYFIDQIFFDLFSIYRAKCLSLYSNTKN